MKQHKSIITPKKNTKKKKIKKKKKKNFFFFFFFFFFWGKSFLNYQTFNRDNILHKLIKKL